MKKMFFFRSHSSSTTNNNQSSPQQSTEKFVSREKPVDKVEKGATNKKGSEAPASPSPPCLRRSLSFSSGSPRESGNNLGKGDQTGSPCSSSSQSRHFFSRPRALTPDRQNRWSRQKKEKDGSRVPSDISEASSYSSSNKSNKFLDRFIDGEQLKGKYSAKTSPSRNHLLGNENIEGKRPPRIQFHVPVSYDGSKVKPVFQSFREIKEFGQRTSPANSGDLGHGIDCTRKLASHVVERLSQSQLLNTAVLKESELDNPITIADVYGSSLNKFSRACNDEMSSRASTIDYWQGQANVGSENGEISSQFIQRELSSGDKERALDSFVDSSAHDDLDLFRKHQDAEKRTAKLSAELEEADFLQLNDLSVPILVQTIRSLMEEKLKMAYEVTAVLEDRIADRVFFREKIKLDTAELDAKFRRLENGKNELQHSLEKELDRRSSEWSMKLEKLQVEEQRLRDRVRELAEQNVGLQREVSSTSETETSARDKVAKLEKQVRDLSFQVQEAIEENQYVQKSLSEMQNRFRAAEEDRDCIRRNYDDKVSECKHLHQAITRLRRTCNDQDKTIDGLRELCEDMGQKIMKDGVDFRLGKMQMEHMRLAGVEHTLRKEVESCKAEIDSLRCENIDLLTRLKNSRNMNEPMTFKLDRELQNRVKTLQDQFLSLLKESTQLGRKLLTHVKSKSGFPTKKGLDGQVLVEFEVTLQGLERAVDYLSTSMLAISNVLHEKSMLNEDCYGQIQMSGLNEEMHVRTQQKSEEKTKSELKTEILLTTVLREKLYAKELEIEQLQAELAAAVRGNDILKSEMQNAEDDLSCINHKTKELELQLIKKDETINQLQHDLQECSKELGIFRGILPKVSEERDQMWEQVKQMTEKHMLLNSEICSLKKKIEVLDEDVLEKEGQITILKDSVTKQFDLLPTQMMLIPCVGQGSWSL